MISKRLLTTSIYGTPNTLSKPNKMERGVNGPLGTSFADFLRGLKLFQYFKRGNHRPFFWNSKYPFLTDINPIKWKEVTPGECFSRLPEGKTFSRFYKGLWPSVFFKPQTHFPNDSKMNLCGVNRYPRHEPLMLAINYKSATFLLNNNLTKRRWRRKPLHPAKYNYKSKVVVYVYKFLF